MAIRFNLNTLDTINAFTYLGMMVTYNTSDWEALYRNLRKYKRRWEMAAKVLGKTGAPIKARVMMKTEFCSGLHTVNAVDIP